MARVTPAERPNRRRLGLLLICFVLLLAAAGCGDDDSVFDTNPDGSPNTQSTLPGGLGGEDNQGDGSNTAGSGSNPGGSAAALPANAQVYAGFDLNALGDLQRLVQAFGAADPAALTEGLGDTAGQAVGEVTAAEDLLTCLGDGLGIEAASLPAWIGGEAALGLYDMQLDAATGDMSDPNALAVVAVADQAAAEAALPGIITSLGTCAGATFTEADYQGVTVYGATPADGGQPMAIALTAGYLVYGEGTGIVERAIGLGDGASLADDPNFSEVLAALPDGRHLTGYMAVGLLQQAVGAAAGAAGQSSGIGLPNVFDPTQMLAGMRGLGLAATLLDEGVRLEMVAVGQPNETLSVGTAAATDVAGLLPADAIGFAGIGAFDVPAAWSSLMDLLAQMPVEEGGTSVNDTIAMVGTMLGIDIERDLVDQLTGEVGLGLLPATAGSLVTGSGVNLGIIAVLGVRDAGAMATTAQALATGLGSLSGTPATPRPFDGGTLYALSDGTSDVALFGMAGDHMVITTHESHAAALLAGGDRLAGSARYAEAISGLPEGSEPLLYLDIAALVGALNLEADQSAGVAPLQTVAVSGSMGAQVMSTTVYLRIDY
jgi:hypothetical protein